MRSCKVFNNYMEAVTIIVMYCSNVVKIPLFQGKKDQTLLG